MSSVIKFRKLTKAKGIWLNKRLRGKQQELRFLTPCFRLVHIYVFLVLRWQHHKMTHLCTSPTGFLSLIDFATAHLISVLKAFV